MKVWLDDARELPVGYDRHAHNYDEAITALKTGDVTFISFDHDLGGQYDNDGLFYAEEKTGYDVAKSMVEMTLDGKIKMPQWAVHSMNPAGRARIVGLLESVPSIPRDYRP